MRYSLVLWDFDGTLADTLSGVLRIFNELAVELGFLPVADIGSSRDATPARLLRDHGIPLWKLPALRQAIIARQKGEMANIRLFPGVPEVLERIGRSGCRMGIVSSNAEENIQACLRANGAEQWFEFIVGYPRLLGKQRDPAADATANRPAEQRRAVRRRRSTRYRCRSYCGHGCRSGDLGTQLHGTVGSACAHRADSLPGTVAQLAVSLLVAEFSP